MVYTLGPTGHGTLATFLRGRRVPTLLGFDPLFHFMHEQDVIESLVTTLDTRPRGVFNVAGPQPVPLSMVIRETGRTNIPIPEFVFSNALGRFGLPKLPTGALEHIKYPVTVDGSAFKKATGFAHQIDEKGAMRAYRDAFPRPLS
jgi:UDP-glucose 4-epimerase